jgi:hypothetical protein
MSTQLSMVGIFSGVPDPTGQRLTGEDLKSSGMESVLSHTPQWYREAFSNAVENFPKGRLFTVEDVRAIAGDPPTDEVSSNCMGPLMRGLAAKKLARKTGLHVRAKRTCMNATELAQWIRI